MLKARTLEVAAKKDKTLQDKDKSLEAAAIPEYPKSKKLKFITKNIIPREWLGINQAGIEVMRKRVYFKYKQVVRRYQLL